MISGHSHDLKSQSPSVRAGLPQEPLRRGELALFKQSGLELRVLSSACFELFSSFSLSKKVLVLFQFPSQRLLLYSMLCPSKSVRAVSKVSVNRLRGRACGGVWFLWVGNRHILAITVAAQTRSGHPSCSWSSSLQMRLLDSSGSQIGKVWRHIDIERP